jgi:hypothetical protein
MDFGDSSSVYAHPNPASIRSSVASSQAGTPGSSPIVGSLNALPVPSQATQGQKQFLYPEFISPPQPPQSGSSTSSVIPSSTAPPPSVLVPPAIDSNTKHSENDAVTPMDLSPLDILSQLCTAVLETPSNSPSTTPNVTAPSSPRAQITKQEVVQQSQEKIVASEVNATAPEVHQSLGQTGESSPSKQTSSKYLSPKKQRKPYSPRKATKAAAEIALAAAAALKESKKNHFPWTPAFVAAAESAMAHGIRPPLSKPQEDASPDSKAIHQDIQPLQHQFSDLPAPPPPVAVIKNLSAAASSQLISAPSSPARASKKVHSTPVIPSLAPSSSLMAMITPESTPGRGSKPEQNSSTSS